MSTNTQTHLGLQSGVASRVLREGYGSGAWHGPDLKAALADVTPAIAYWRPGAGRHNIAELAIHHAYFVRSVRAQLSGQAAKPFVLPGEDWFEINDDATLAWREVVAAVEAQQLGLSELVRDLDAGRVRSPLPDAEQFDLVLGITCHAVYHAAQIQLIKRIGGNA